MQDIDKGTRGVYVNIETSKALDMQNDIPLEWVTSVKVKISGQWGFTKRVDVWLTDKDGQRWHGHGVAPDIYAVVYLNFKAAKAAKVEANKDARN